MSRRLEGKVAIVTGAARGMGAATARLFAAEGAHVLLTDVLEDAGRRTAAAFGAAFRRHDVSREDQWQAVVDEALERFGRLDVLVNNAGVLHVAALLDTSKADFERVMAVNVTGVLLGLKAAGAVMVNQGGGAIVNISSVDGFKATNGCSAYSASKWAVRGLTRAAALELGPRGVRVNSVHPGAIDTPMVNPDGRDMDADGGSDDVPAQRTGRAEEVAQASLYLASDEASYCHGTELAVDGGLLAGRYYAFLPGAPDALSRPAS